MKRFIDVLFNTVVTGFVKILGIVMVLSILVQILMRYLPSNPFMWTEELARLTFVWFCFMSATIVLTKGMHLGIDYFYNKVSVRAKTLLTLFTWTLIMIFSGIITYYGSKLVGMTHIQQSPFLSLPLSYFYASVPVAGGLFLIYGTTVIIEMAAGFISAKRRHMTSGRVSSIRGNIK